MMSPTCVRALVRKAYNNQVLTPMLESDGTSGNAQLPLHNCGSGWSNALTVNKLCTAALALTRTITARRRLVLECCLYKGC
jgi:hypothetical protein